MEWGRPEEEAQLLPHLRPSSECSGDLLEQRVNGGEEAFGAIDMMGQCLHVDMSSKYVRAALPAAAVFSFPVAAFVDVQLLTRDAVLAAVKPTGLVVVVRHAWKKRTRY